MSVGTGSAIGFGLKAAFRNLAAVTWRYVASAFAAAPLALAVAFIVDKQLASSLSAEAFAEGLEPVLVLELLLERSDALATIGPILVGSMLAWIVVSAFMTASTIGAVSADHGLRTNELFAAGGRGFGRLIRLLPFGIGTMVLFVGLPGAGLFKLQSKLTEDWISDPAVFATRAAAFGFTLLLFAWANGAYDLMKVEAVAKGEHRARWAFVRGLIRSIKHPFRLLRVYLPFAVFAVAVTLLASLLDVRIVRDSWTAMLVGFGLQQAVTYVRAWSAVALAGAEVALTRREG